MRRSWTSQEDEFLRREFATTSTAELARRLGRTAKSVEYRLAVLGLRRQGPGRPQFRRRLITVREFCADCCLNQRTCGRKVKECMAEADLYSRLFDCTEDEPSSHAHRAIIVMEAQGVG